MCRKTTRFLKIVKLNHFGLRCNIHKRVKANIVYLLFINMYLFSIELCLQFVRILIFFKQKEECTVYHKPPSKGWLYFFFWVLFYVRNNLLCRRQSEKLMFLMGLIVMIAANIN